MKLEEPPKVSIIMGIYNCESTLKESIESIVNQTYTNWELIMCDDCSKDNTFNVAKEYKDKYPEKITLIKNDVNLTLGPTLNKCIKLVDGKYIARQDGDDFSVKERIQKQVEFLEENKIYDLVGCGIVSFDDNGNHGIRMLELIPKKKDLMRGATFAHATILIKSKVMKELDGYSEEEYTNQVEDYHLWFRFFEKGYKGYNLQETLYYVREGRDAYKRKNMKRRINEVKVMVEGIRRLRLPTNNYVMLIKPIIAMIIPNNILMKYHKNKFRIG